MDLIDILLIEDNAYDEELTLRAFSKQNLTNKIHVIRDGQDALDYLASLDNPCLKFILLDLKLPRVSGTEILEFIKNNPKLNRIPVVVLSSSALDPDVQKAYALGVNSYVTKPIDFAEFAKVISTLGLYWAIINKTSGQ